MHLKFILVYKGCLYSVALLLRLLLCLTLWGPDIFRKYDFFQPDLAYIYLKGHSVPKS